MDLNYSPHICPQTTEFSFNPPLVSHHTVIHCMWSAGRNSVVAQKQQNQAQRQRWSCAVVFHPSLGVEEEHKAEVSHLK